MRLAVVLLVACSSPAKPAPQPVPAPASPPAIPHASHTCADAALSLENATRGVRAPEHDVFDALREKCLLDPWPAGAVDCFATMREGDLGKCAGMLADDMREPVFAALAGKEPGGNIFVTRARLQQLQVGVPECDRFVAAVTTALSCERLAIEDRLDLGNETASFWSLPTSRLSVEDKDRISHACGESLASLEKHAHDVGCML